MPKSFDCLDCTWAVCAVCQGCTFLVVPPTLKMFLHCLMQEEGTAQACRDVLIPEPSCCLVLAVEFLLSVGCFSHG